MARWFSLIICLFLMQLVLPVASFATPGKVAGSAELIFAGQTAETGGVKTLDASHFVQQYSFLWSKKDKISKGRLGEYDIALGYEWNWVDSEINGQKVEIDNPLDKLLYRGDIKFAPGGLPFRIHAFSYDMHQTSFTSTDLGTLFDNGNEQQSTGSLGIVTGVSNGTHVVSGVTLEAGVQNGHYHGKYRDLLATLPRLLIDYKQQVVRDVKGPNKQDYVDRDLAFVSLNKKSNWLHYRRFEHEDLIDSTQNTSEDTILLGTIDHTNRRQWINLTNWIKISTDISYNENRSERGTVGLDNSRRYDVNFFAKASRTRWQLDNFTSYSRVRTDGRLEHQLDVPFFARGELNRDTAWRFELQSGQYRDVSVNNTVDRQRDSIYVRGQVETFRQARYIIRPELQLETKSGTEGTGQSARAAVELYSNRKYRGLNDLFARYGVMYTSGTGTAGFQTTYLEQELKLRMENQVNSRIRFGAEEQLVYGTGSYDTTVSDHLTAVMAGVASFEGAGGSFDDDLTSSKTSGFVEIVSSSGLKNNFGANFDFIDSNRVSGSQYGINHRLDYNKNALDLNWYNSYVSGDGMPNSSSSLGSGSGAAINSAGASTADFSSSISSSLRLTYSMGRASRFSTTLDYEQFSYKDGASVDRVKADETYEYTLWHVNGRVRKIMVLGESVEYSKSTVVSNAADDLMAYSVFSNYYPTFNTLLSARLRYEQSSFDDSETMLTYLTAGMDFKKFQASIDYSYGRRPETSTKPEVLEQKWEVKVKKTF